MNPSTMLRAFCDAVEQRNGTAFAELFTEDGVYHDVFYGAFEGRAKIAGLIDDWFYRTATDFRWDMVGAFAYDFYKNRAEMTVDHIGVIAIGFVVSFITAIIVVKTFLTYVTRHGFTLFAWWRVIVGTLGLIALALGR